MVEVEEWGTACKYGFAVFLKQGAAAPPVEVGEGGCQEGKAQVWRQVVDLQASQGGEQRSPDPAGLGPHPYPVGDLSSHRLVCQGHSFAVKRRF